MCLRIPISANRRHVKFLVLFLGFFTLSDPAAAGQQSASIIGQVSDTSGGVLPGVTITATSSALQTESVTAVTDEHGEYRLTRLPIGSYDVTYALAGFQTLKREGVRLTVDFSAKLDVKLEVGTLAETLTVSGSSPVVDVTSASTSTRLTHETIELIPTSRNGVIGIMAQAPGVRPNIDVGGNTINAVPVFHAFGQDGESWQMIEGLPAYSPKSGVQSNQFWDYNAFEEAKVETVGHNADIPTRGIAINSIIKSGSNEFHGELFGAKTSQGLESDNITSTLAAQGITLGNPVVTRYDYSGDVGGRIERDTLWFFYATRRRFEVDGVLGLTQPDGSPAQQPNGQLFSTEKITYQINKSNQISGYAMWTRKDTTSGLSNLTNYDSRVDQINDGWNSRAEWNAVHSDSLTTNVGFGVWGFYSTYYGFSNQPSTIDQLTGRIAGLNTDVGDSPLERRYHWNGSVSKYKTNLIGGEHLFKVGGDFMAERGDRPYVSRATVGGAGAGNYQLIFRNGAPFEMLVYNFPVEPFDKRHYLGLYAEDAWTVARRVTLNLGVRYAHDAGFVPAQCRGVADGPSEITFPAACYAQHNFNVWNPIVPRLHVAWDVTGDGRTSVKGGWSRYAHMRMMDELQQANALAASQALYKWHDSDGDKAYAPGDVNFSTSGSDFVSINLLGGGAPTNGVPNPNEKEPMNDELFLTFEREVVRNIALRVTGIYSRNTNVYRLQNDLRPYSVYDIPITRPDPGPDGKSPTGALLTYYDYPAQYAGIAFQQATLINDPKAASTYKSIEAAVSKRLTRGWQFMTSISASKTDNPYVFSTGGGLTLGISELTPNAEILSAQHTWEWLARATGSYLFPGGFTAAVNFESRSGTPFARTVSLTGGVQIPSITVRAEPIGAERYPEINLLNLRGDKSFRLGRHQVIARLNVYNVTNSPTVTTLTTLSGPNFMRPTQILPPRIFELSATYKF